MDDKIDQFHKHEALDRQFMIMTMFCDFVLEHPYIQDKFKEQAEKIADAMHDLYQAIGCEHL